MTKHRYTVEREETVRRTYIVYADSPVDALAKFDDGEGSLKDDETLETLSPRVYDDSGENVTLRAESYYER